MADAETNEAKRRGPEPRFTMRLQLPIEPAIVGKIDALGVNRSAFIREAITRELKRRERIKP